MESFCRWLILRRVIPAPVFAAIARFDNCHEELEFQIGSQTN
jgi:hypothetical protein